MFERRSSLHLFDIRMGKKRTVRSQAHLHDRVPEAGIFTPLLCQEASLEVGNSSQMHALDALCANHRKVTTVPFLPICQGSTGKKRIIILQEKKKKNDVISSLANALYSKTPSWAPLPWAPRPACLSLAGILQACLIPLMISHCGPVRGRMVAAPRHSTQQPLWSLYALSGHSEGQPSHFQTEAPRGHVQCPSHLCFLKA